MSGTGESHLIAAQKHLKKGKIPFFSSGPDYEAAATEFEEAAKLFKTSNPVKAVAAHKSAAESWEKSGSHYYSGKQWIAAAQLLQKGRDNGRVETLLEISKYYVNASESFTLAQSNDSAAENMGKAARAMQDCDVPDAIELHKRCIELYVQEERYQLAMQPVKDALAFCISKNRFQDVIQFYETLEALFAKKPNAHMQSRMVLSMLIYYLHVEDGVRAKQEYEKGLLKRDEANIAAQILEAIEHQNEDSLRAAVGSQLISFFEMNFQIKIIGFFLSLVMVFSNTKMSHGLQCKNFTLDKCTLDLGGVLMSIGTKDQIECQLICNVVYGGVCQMYHFNNVNSLCSLTIQSVEQHVRSCTQIGGPKVPNVDDCLAETDPCNFYHDENCDYKGIQIAFFPSISSQSICQLTCTITDGCEYFLFDFDVKDCQLFDSSEKECEISVGPAQPSLEDCILTTTEASTTTTTPIAPGGCTTEVYYKSDGSCACGFFLEPGLTWFEALHQCTALGARLPEIYTEQENADIFNLKPNPTDLNGGMWLGGSDLVTEGMWIWNSTGKLLEFYNWMEGEPNNGIADPENSGQNCLQMWKDKGQWDDLYCDYAVQGNFTTPLYTLCELNFNCNF